MASSWGDVEWDVWSATPVCERMIAGNVSIAREWTIQLHCVRMAMGAYGLCACIFRWCLLQSMEAISWITLIMLLFSVAITCCESASWKILGLPIFAIVQKLEFQKSWCPPLGSWWAELVYLSRRNKRKYKNFMSLTKPCCNMLEKQAAVLLFLFPYALSNEILVFQHLMYW